MAVEPDGENLEIWRFDNNETIKWTLLPATGAPNWIEDFDMALGAYEEKVFFLVQSNIIYRGIYNSSSPATIAWQAIYPPGSPSNNTLAARESGDILVGGNDGKLARGIWNNVSLDFDFTDIPAGDLWTDDYDFEDIWLDGDGTTAVASATSRADNGHYTTLLLKITNVFSDNPAGEDPVVEALSLEGLSTGIAAQVAMAGGDYIWYGSNSGYLGLWDGSFWQPKTGATVSGYPGYAEVTQDSALLTVVGGTPGVLMDLAPADQVITELPEGAMPTSTWQAGPNDIWLFERNGAAYHYDGADFTSEDISAQVGEGNIYKAWGTSSTDIWAVGGNSEGAIILHYNGAGWVRDTEAESVLGGEMAAGVGGTGTEDVYVSGTLGFMIHFDGISWTKLEQNVFSEPEGFGECMTEPPSGCAGNGSGFSAMHMNVTEDGTLYAGILDGVYGVLADAEAGCETGEYRCVLEPAGEEFMSTSVVRFADDTWSLLPLPEPGGDWMTVLYGLWGAGVDRAYANQISMNETDESFEWSIMTWDGTEWTALDDQPAFSDLFFFLDGSVAGDIWGSGFEGMEHIMRYQTCDH